MWNTKRLRLAVGAMFVAAIVLLGTDLPKPIPRILEFSLYVSWLVLLSAYGPLRRMLGELPRPQRRFLIAFLGVLLASQVINKARRTFPFVPWGMYTQSLAGSPLCFEYVGVRDDGSEVQIRSGEVFPSQGRLVGFRLGRQWVEMESEGDAVRRQQMSTRFRALLVATGRRFNELHPGAQVRRIRLVRCTTPRPFPGRELPVTRRAVAEFAIE